MVVVRGVLYILIVVVAAACGGLDTSPPAGLESVEIAPADILFRRGGSWESHVVLQADGGEYSHVGVAVEMDGVVMAAHAVPAESEGERDVVKIEPLERFFGADRAVAGAVKRYVLSSEERGCVDSLARAIVAGERPFDHSYSLEDSSEIYCSELLWILFKSIGRDVSCGERSRVNIGLFSAEMILPSDIYNSRETKLVWSFDRRR